MNLQLENNLKIYHIHVSYQIKNNYTLKNVLFFLLVVTAMECKEHFEKITLEHTFFMLHISTEVCALRKKWIETLSIYAYLEIFTLSKT